MKDKIIRDIWILTRDGIVLFSRVFHEQVEEQLFGALVSALSSFSDKLLEGGLQNFELKKLDLR